MLSTLLKQSKDKGEMKTMKNYVSPELTVLALQSEEVMLASEEAFDINVSFDELWGTGI